MKYFWTNVGVGLACLVGFVAVPLIVVTVLSVGVLVLWPVIPFVIVGAVIYSSNK